MKLVCNAVAPRLRAFDWTRPAVIGCLGGVLGIAAGCRELNPRFEQSLGRGEFTSGEDDVELSGITEQTVSEDRPNTLPNTRPNTRPKPVVSTETDAGQSSTPVDGTTSRSSDTSKVTSLITDTSSAPVARAECGEGLELCYLIDGNDTPGSIRDVNGSGIDLVMQHGTKAPAPPELPQGASVLTISQDGPAATASAAWTPPTAGGFAFDARVKLASLSAGNRLVVGLYGRMLLVVDASGRLTCSFNQGDQKRFNYVDAPPGPAADTDWHHVGCEFNGTGVRTWVDGVATKYNSCASPVPIPDIVLQLGGNSDVSTKTGPTVFTLGQFRGSVSVFRVWADRALFAKAMSGS